MRVVVFAGWVTSLVAHCFNVFLMRYVAPFGILRFVCRAALEMTLT
jgi:hypothetical protein